MGRLLICSFVVQASKAAEGGRGLETLRRYEVAWVRRSAMGRSLPQAFLQADLDFLASGNKSLPEAALLEAEAIKAIAEVRKSVEILAEDAILKIAFPLH